MGYRGQLSIMNIIILKSIGIWFLHFLVAISDGIPGFPFPNV
jgi:hypothetical protein